MPCISIKYFSYIDRKEIKMKIVYIKEDEDLF